MEVIFHEKQEGSLCAQHCLNNLLQGEYFSAVDLSSIAMQLDEQERMRMAEGGLATEDYRTFMQQPSGNMDDSGFFSIQVISDALGVWGLELILFNSREYRNRGINPINERAFIGNYKEHWFTVRKLGKQWFNLNSLLTGPELISDTYLALFLAQLQQEGYSIFVVKGDLPECEADQLLQMVQVHQSQRPRLIGEDAAARDQRVQRSEAGIDGDQLYDSPAVMDEDEENLQKALALSRQQIDMEDEEADLRRAIQLSMQGGHQSEFTESLSNTPQSSRNRETEQLTSEELRQKRQAYYEKFKMEPLSSEGLKRTTNAQTVDSDNGLSEEDMLKAATKTSVDTGEQCSKSADGN
ncbi:ataxin-3 isoform X2 [Xenopus laevis]|uniref:ubiquitinyl hydrolase 1 n=1 Tax=Xenopus laevis TaxID=8355 RepID=A0A8J1LJS6_XENLA|nr:ataxin-3 isoform X2 [Xenopus laevis]